MFNLVNETKTCVNIFVQAGAEFTAYDITKELRQLYPNEDIPHANGVREIVHDLFEIGDSVFGNYNRELDYSFGISPAPWRYYPGLTAQIVKSMVAITNAAPVVQAAKSGNIKPYRAVCTKCFMPLHKKGFGLYQVQRYRCSSCGAQCNEFSNSVFHNRKHRPGIILDALWCLAHAKPNIYTANAVGVSPRTVLTWRRVTKETWSVSSLVIQSLDTRFDDVMLDKLKAALNV